MSLGRGRSLKARNPAKGKGLGSKRIEGKDRRFIVSVASPNGGGRQMVYARNPREAEDKALVNQFAKGSIPRGTSVIVTDLSKTTDSQTFSRYT